MLGKYYSGPSLHNNMYYVESINNGIVHVRETLKDYIPNAVLDLKVRHTLVAFQNLINSGQIVEIEPPTIFIVTSRRNTILKNNGALKNALKKAGARYVSDGSFWYFEKEPDKNLCNYKESLVYPFTKKKYR